MTEPLSLYGKLLRPWLTVAVYLWALLLIADFSIKDSEPLLDRLADCSAILWTLMFWSASAVIVLWLIAFPAGGALLVEQNKRGAKFVLVAITAIAFVRWLLNWANLIGNPEIVTFALVFFSLWLSSWVWRRRKRLARHTSSLPSLDQAWSCFAVPVLAMTAMTLAVTMGEHEMLLRDNPAELRKILSIQCPGAVDRHRPDNFP